MVNQKPRPCSATIEDIVNSWTKSIVYDLGNGCQPDDEHVGQIFEAD